MALTLITTIELFIGWILVVWIMIATIKGLKKVAPVPSVKQLDLMKGIWKLEIALGFSLCALVVLGTFTAINFPYSFGILTLSVTFVIFLLIHKATKDFERVPTISSYVEKIRAWAEKQK